MPFPTPHLVVEPEAFLTPSEDRPSLPPGAVAIVRMTSLDDIGRIINHMIVEGQIQGGIAQGVGQALYEQAVYDAESGQLLTGSLMDYGVPRADQMPAMTAAFEEGAPCKTNLLGVKGVGARSPMYDGDGPAPGWPPAAGGRSS